MKSLSFLLIALFSLFSLTAFVPSATPEDDAAIKAVIAAETQAFFDRDFNAWANCWLQSAHDSQAWNNRDGSVFYNVGWDKVGAGAKAWIESNPKPAKAPVISRDQWNIHVSGDMASVSFQQTFSDGKETGTSWEFRTMGRKGGQWKISTVQAFWDYKNVKK
jgi:Domain of unknown function (DUF4440)